MLALEENESPTPVLSLPWGPIHPQALAAQTQELQLRELLFTLDVDMICWRNLSDVFRTKKRKLATYVEETSSREGQDPGSPPLQWLKRNKILKFLGSSQLEYLNWMNFTKGHSNKVNFPSQLGPVPDWHWPNSHSSKNSMIFQNMSKSIQIKIERNKI